jgi:hypothetical protein
MNRSRIRNSARRAHANRAQADRRHADELAALLRAVLEAPAVTEPAARAAAFRGDALPPPLGEYAARVQAESGGIAEIEALLAGGCTPDAVFEITVAAAVGAAMHQLQAGLTVLREGH